MAELAMFGLTPGDLDDADVDLLPDNVTAARVFVAMSTQWRVGPAGATGLDYAALPAVLRLSGVPRDQHHDTFQALRTMEREALAFFAEESK